MKRYLGVLLAVVVLLVMVFLVLVVGRSGESGLDGSGTFAGGMAAYGSAPAGWMVDTGFTLSVSGQDGGRSEASGTPLDFSTLWRDGSVGSSVDVAAVFDWGDLELPDELGLSGEREGPAPGLGVFDLTDPLSSNWPFATYRPNAASGSAGSVFAGGTQQGSNHFGGNGIWGPAPGSGFGLGGGFGGGGSGTGTKHTSAGPAPVERTTPPNGTAPLGVTPSSPDSVPDYSYVLGDPPTLEVQGDADPNPKSGQSTPVPEPAPFALLAIGLIAAVLLIVRLSRS